MDPAQANALTAALQNLGTLVQGLVQQVQQQHQPPPPPAQVAFHRSPLGTALPNQLIDYSTKEGKKFHSLATRPLFPKDEYFDVEPDKFPTFMTLLMGRCKDLGFTATGGMCMVPPDAANPQDGDPINTVEDFGRASMEQIRAWETTFLADDAGAQGRLAQDSKILYDLCMNSMSTQGLARIKIWKHQYCIPVGNNNTIFESGGCLLKVIVRESYLDSNATISTIRLQLSSLDTYVHDNGTDIIELNAHVRSLMDGLVARGQTTQDLLVNLFKGYKACTDVDFLNYITGLENSHEDGTADMTSDVLMERTSNYYKKRLVSPTNKWEEKKDPAAELLAMEARVKKVEKDQKKKVTFRQPDVSGKGGKNGKGGKQTPKQPKLEKPSWLKNNEKPNDLTKSRTWNGSTWYWCDTSTGGKCGGAWGAHDPKQCRGQRSKRKSNKDRTPDAKRARANKIIKAQQAVIDGLSDESDATIE